MYYYHTIIRYHYSNDPLYHLGILIDNASTHTSLRYADMFLDQGVEFRFPVVSLRQWQHQLEAWSLNIFEAQTPDAIFD